MSLKDYFLKRFAMIGKKSCFRSHSGFSLAELVIVLMGAMIILGISVPVVDRVMDSYRLVMAAQTVTTEIQYARMKSVASNESFRVNFPASQKYFQVETTGGGAVVSGPFYLPNGLSWNGVTFPGRYVEFLPTGNIVSSGNGSAGVVTIINGAALKVDITVGIGGMIHQSTPYH